MGEFGKLTEEKAQLELALTQEEFYYAHIDQRKNMTLLGVVLNIALLVVIALFIVAVWMGAFAIVVAPVLMVFWIALLVFIVRRETKNVKKLLYKEFDKEKIESWHKCEKMKQQIQELEEEIQKVQVKRWSL